MNGKPTFLDLFCGCGGFTLGLRKAGYACLAAIDFNPQAMTVFRANFPEVKIALEADMTQLKPESLGLNLAPGELDLIVGGPPCQGFSMARRRDGSNHGENIKADPRRTLYREFLRFVGYFRPKVFIMENVLGMRTSEGGRYLCAVQAEARKLGYRVHAQMEDCAKLGLPQKRRRQLVMGTRLDLPGIFRPDLAAETGWNKPPRPLGEALMDLPALEAGEGSEECEYDYKLRTAYEKQWGMDYLYNTLEVHKARRLTAHRARPHSARDLRDFARLRQGESSAQAMRRGVEFEFPYDRTKFADRYTRQSLRNTCSTIVAHLGKDGLMFIHPTQDRSLTAREAARVQSFPDWFTFPIARTHQYRVIGNAVPPLVGEAVGRAVGGFLRRASSHAKPGKLVLNPAFMRDGLRVGMIRDLLNLRAQELRKEPHEEFKLAWYAIANLLTHLHPDSAQDHGLKTASDFVTENPELFSTPELCNPYFLQSGWPVALKSIADEARKRYQEGRMSEHEYYCGGLANFEVLQKTSYHMAEELAARRRTAS